MPGGHARHDSAASFGPCPVLQAGSFEVLVFPDVRRLDAAFCLQVGAVVGSAQVDHDHPRAGLAQALTPVSATVPPRDAPMPAMPAVGVCSDTRASQSSPTHYLRLHSPALRGYMRLMSSGIGRDSRLALFLKV